MANVLQTYASPWTQTILITHVFANQLYFLDLYLAMIGLNIQSKWDKTSAREFLLLSKHKGTFQLSDFLSSVAE
jgi:hypothetical protein